MLNEDTVLVTGARGFIAKHCVASLLAQGYRVVGTVRTAEAEDEVRRAVETVADAGDRLSFVQANLLSNDGWSEAMKDVRFVLHVASPYPVATPKDPNDLFRPAREGTLRVLKAAKAAGVERVILTSSVAAVAAGRRDKTLFDETDWTDAESSRTSAYARSKTLAERAAWDFVEENGGPELVVINPAQVFGPPLDDATGTSSDLIEMFLAGKLPAVIRFGFPVVDVRDVAKLHVAALENPEAAGHRFIASAEFFWMIDIARILRDRFPDRARRLPKWEIPDPLARIGALFRSDIKTARGDLGRLWQTSAGKAEQTFEMTFRPAKEAVVAMAEKLVASGRVK